ncbi:MAG: hypothetical protein U1F00_01850 [Rhodoferax sp.]
MQALDLEDLGSGGLIFALDPKNVRFLSVFSLEWGVDMRLRGIWMALLALIFAGAMGDASAAYPTTARSGTTTVTGVYRPLDLNLSLVDGTGSLDYCYACYGFGSQTLLYYSATYRGTYSGYSQTGDSGDWHLTLGFWGDNSLFTDDGTTIKLTLGSTAFSVGSLTYQGGGNYAGVPYADTPQAFDTFDLYPTLGGASDALLDVTCADGTAVCTNFVMRLLQNITLQGPYVWVGARVAGWTTARRKSATTTTSRTRRSVPTCVRIA